MELPGWIQRRRDRPRDRLRLLDGGAAAYPAMLEAIDAAREEIFLEVYAFALDAVGLRFIEALGAASRRGVRVRVVVDGWGSTPHAHEVASQLEAFGCDVEIFNRMLFALLGRWRRNHRKILAVDGAVAYLGGINVGAAYGLPGEPRSAAWADLAL